LYTYDDISFLEKKFKKFLIYFTLATILFMIVLFALCKNWGTVLDPVRLPAWPGYAAGVAYAVFAVFSWGMKGSRLLRYRGFIYNILTGLERNVEGEVVSVSTDISYDNYLEFYSVEIAQGKDIQNRRLYIDAVKGPGELLPGSTVKLKIFENYIKDIVS